MKLTFKNDTFKILQIADTQEGRKVSPDTLALISAALDREEPDLVVYSGDQIWGRGFHGDVAGRQVDARAPLEKLEAALGEHLAPGELDEEIDTVGGLVSALAGRVPQRGEVIAHPAGFEIQVLDSDARRVKRVRFAPVAAPSGEEV